MLTSSKSDNLIEQQGVLWTHTEGPTDPKVFLKQHMATTKANALLMGKTFFKQRMFYTIKVYIRYYYNLWYVVVVVRVVVIVVAVLFLRKGSKSERPVL